MLANMKRQERKREKKKKRIQGQLRAKALEAFNGIKKEKMREEFIQKELFNIFDLQFHWTAAQRRAVRHREHYSPRLLPYVYT